MLNAMKASLYKMFHDRAFRLCLVGTVAWAMIVIMAQVLTAGSRGIEDVSQLANRWGGFIGLHSIEVPLIMSAITLFTGEFRDKSWKLLIAKGISRSSYYFSKLVSILLLTGIISFSSIATTAIANVLLLHATLDGAYLRSCILFSMGQCLAHMTIATLVLAVIFLIRSGEIAAIISMFAMVFGYVILHVVEMALGLGELITDIWAFSQPAFVEFAGPISWARLGLVLIGHLAVCSVIVMVRMSIRDIE